MNFECPVCRSNDTKLFLEGIFDDPNTNVIECNNCGMRFLDKIMTVEEETEFYRNYYENQKNRQYQETNLEYFQNRTYNEYMKEEDFFVNLLKDKKDILEVGCGSGGFLKFIKEHFDDKNITAVDISESNLEFLRDISKNNFEDIEFYQNINEIKDKKFDFICSFGVLEHNRDSRKYLKEQIDLLKDNNSRLLVGVPNKDATLVEFFKLEEFIKFEYMKMHYYTFCEGAFNVLSDELGMKVNEFKYMQMFGLDNALSWLKNRKPQDFSYYTNVLSDKTLESFRQDMSKNKTTDFLLTVMSIK